MQYARCPYKKGKSHTDITQRRSCQQRHRENASCQPRSRGFVCWEEDWSHSFWQLSERTNSADMLVSDFNNKFQLFES